MRIVVPILFLSSKCLVSPVACKLSLTCDVADMDIEDGAADTDDAAPEWAGGGASLVRHLSLHAAAQAAHRPRGSSRESAATGNAAMNSSH